MYSFLAYGTSGGSACRRYGPVFFNRRYQTVKSSRKHMISGNSQTIGILEKQHAKFPRCNEKRWPLPAFRHMAQQMFTITTAKNRIHDDGVICSRRQTCKSLFLRSRMANIPPVLDGIRQLRKKRRIVGNEDNRTHRCSFPVIVRGQVVLTQAETRNIR